MANSEWRIVGETEYRAVAPSEIAGAAVRNADCDAIYLWRLHRHFVVYLNGQDNPINEYRRVERVDA
jgi:hypothetical protein